ncbi:hypothetical protein L916_21658 [Phytophthora nicotianae]|uniref:Uncharacterized protein n=1 Tax=Phytophthora nicotianae TaxID=4792 RepID=W2HQR8_PHYNI|nr:hypothetical protein L916_21658 [Phytophthora nicotianae]
MELRIRTAGSGQCAFPNAISSGALVCVYQLPCENSVLHVSDEMHSVPLLAALEQALFLHSVLGLIHPHHFRNVLHQDVPRFPCISVGRKSSPTNTKMSLISVDHGSHTLLERVAALEQSQSAELAALQQELRILRAQIATAAQTTSDIQVELGSKLMRLSDRVVALEKQTYAASSSSSSH